MALVEVNQLRVSFGEKTAVSAASFAIEKGETFSLIGESGCGKSTLAKHARVEWPHFRPRGKFTARTTF